MRNEAIQELGSDAWFVDETIFDRFGGFVFVRCRLGFGSHLYQYHLNFKYHFLLHHILKTSILYLVSLPRLR